MNDRDASEELEKKRRKRSENEREKREELNRNFAPVGQLGVLLKWELSEGESGPSLGTVSYFIDLHYVTIGDVCKRGLFYSRTEQTSALV